MGPQKAVPVHIVEAWSIDVTFRKWVKNNDCTRVYVDMKQLNSSFPLIGFMAGRRDSLPDHRITVIGRQGDHQFEGPEQKPGADWNSLVTVLGAHSELALNTETLAAMDAYM